MIKFTSETLAVIIIILALLIAAQQYGAPRFVEAMQERLEQAAKVQSVRL